MLLQKAGTCVCVCVCDLSWLQMNRHLIPNNSGCLPSHSRVRRHFEMHLKTNPLISTPRVHSRQEREREWQTLRPRLFKWHHIYTPVTPPPRLVRPQQHSEIKAFGSAWNKERKENLVMREEPTRTKRSTLNHLRQNRCSESDDRNRKIVVQLCHR